MIIRNCNKCKGEYLATPAYLKRGEGIYCSKKCAIDASRKKRIHHENNVNCAICGVGFYKKPSHLILSKSGLYFCSKEHQREAVIKKIIKPGPPCINLNKIRIQECKFCFDYIKNSDIRDYHIKCEKIFKWLNGDNSVTLNSNGQPRETKRFVKNYLLKINLTGKILITWLKKPIPGEKS